MTTPFSNLKNKVIMEKQTYEAPLVEIIEVEVEKGFATSNRSVDGSAGDFPFG